MVAQAVYMALPEVVGAVAGTAIHPEQVAQVAVVYV
jgi:hypothetical protein